MRRAAILLFLLSPIAASAQSVPVPAKRPDAPPLNESSPADLPVIRRTACAALLAGLVSGRAGAPIREGECGTDSPLIVNVAGQITLVPEATITCGIASALAQLLPQASAIAQDILGSPLAALHGVSGYECRNRNRAASGKLSEHGFANALDVSSFVLADGRSIGVGAYWPHLANPPATTAKPPLERAETAQARFLASVHAAACKRFSTVLGPDANAEHREHLHFDLGCHGKDCSYLICQ